MDKLHTSIGLFISFTCVCFSLFALSRSRISSKKNMFGRLTGVRSQESLQDTVRGSNGLILGVAACALLASFVVQVMIVLKG